MKAAISLGLGLFAVPGLVAQEAGIQILPAREAEWDQLNPARGDASPRAATLWGDRSGSGPTGFLLRFKDGFSSPPHIHNVSYRAVVLRGRIHNDHPRAPTRWMAQGTFWTQPRGEVHITAAEGPDVMALVEIDEGPYLVRPIDQAFSSGEEPLNLHASNVVWVDAHAPTREVSRPPRIAYLSGDPAGERPSRVFVEVSSRSAAVLRLRGAELRAVVVQGRPRVRVPGTTEATATELGDYLEANRPGTFRLACPGPEDCVAYLGTRGDFELYGVRPWKVPAPR